MVVPKHLSDLQPLERARFATIARLLSCLITESLVPAFYKPLESKDISGIAIALRSETLLDLKAFSADDILAIIPLHYPPVFKPDGHTPLGRAIGLLDPLDMMPIVFETGLGYPIYDVSIEFLISLLRRC